MKAKPKMLLIIGGALLASALGILLIAEQVRGDKMVTLALRLSACFDAGLGLGALFLGLRRLGETGNR